MSGLLSKQKWLDAAEIIDAWRVVPRILVFSYTAWTIKVVHDVLTWYQSIPHAERGLEASGLTGAVITAVTGLCTWALKIYMQSGRDWTGPKDGAQ